MKILAPVNTVESAISLIKAGADEIYLGADENLFKTFSFTGRGKLSYGGLRVLPSYDDFKQIVQYAHKKNVRVNYIANTQFFHNGSIKNTDIEKDYIRYVEIGVGIGVDSIVIGDIGLLNCIHNQNYNIDLHASIYFKTLNSYQLLFLKECGVTRTTLSYHVTLNEITELTKTNIMEIEVIGYLGCSFFNGACGFLHELGEGILSEFNPGIACKNIFCIKNDNNLKNVSFDVEVGCAICSLGKLEKIGVQALKIVGRDRNLNQMEEVVKLYKSMLIAFRESKYENVNKSVIPEWWKRVWCSKNKCKYKKNPYSSFIIGDDNDY